MTSKILVLFLVCCLAVLRIHADAGDLGEGLESEDLSSLRVELEQLRSKISDLESSVVEGNRKLKSKEETIFQLENEGKEKAELITSLHAEIESLQKKDAVDAAELVGRAHARADDLEKQIENLKNDIQVQNRKKDALEARVVEAENKVVQLNAKLENLQQINDEQKRRIKKTERALKVAEEELMKVRLEASSKKRELTEIHGAWLPPWLAAQWDQFQVIATVKWNKHGKPAYDASVKKVSEVFVQALKKIEPHLETAKRKWIPAMEEQWANVRTSAQPYAELLATKSVDVYQSSLDTVRPYLLKVQQVAEPYLQDAKKISKPYVDQIATVTKPHVEKIRVVLKPYTKKVVNVYGKSLKSATTYHRQVQAGVRETLKKRDATKALATREFVWFVASSLLALPAFIVFQLVASIFRKKPKRRSQNSHANHAPRRHKRRHTDK